MIDRKLSGTTRSEGYHRGRRGSTEHYPGRDWLHLCPRRPRWPCANRTRSRTPNLTKPEPEVVSCRHLLHSAFCIAHRRSCPRHRSKTFGSAQDVAGVAYCFASIRVMVFEDHGPEDSRSRRQEFQRWQQSKPSATTPTMSNEPSHFRGLHPSAVSGWGRMAQSGHDVKCREL